MSAGRGAGLEALSRVGAGGLAWGLCVGRPLPSGATGKPETQEDTPDSGCEAEGNVHLTKYTSQGQGQGRLHQPLPPQRKMEK